MERTGARLFLYPNYNGSLRMLARAEGKGVTIEVLRDYDTSLRKDHFDGISLDEFVTDMCEGAHPVAKEEKEDILRR